MATTINNYDGTELTTVADGAINTTSSSIKFPGRGFVNYGEPVNENMLWIMQNFASGSPGPSNPVNGQTWYDTDNKILKVYDATTSTWLASGGVIRSPTAPGSAPNSGSLWFDTTKNQMWTWSGSQWLLIGPLGASDGNDPTNPSVPSYSRIEAALISDGTSVHPVWRIVIGGTVFAILSRDSVFTPSPAISGFPTISPGINLNNTVAGIGVAGDSTVFRTTQDNFPVANNSFTLGSSTNRFSTVFATTFNGTATSAQYADLAERYHGDRSYPPGTVVCLGGENEITASSIEGDESVFGVISTDPAFLMNSEAGDETHPPVALVGRVPCRVVGAVRKGQRLMASSLEGAACAWDPSKGVLSILGRSLENKDTAGVGLIEIVVGKQ